MREIPFQYSAPRRHPSRATNMIAAQTTAGHHARMRSGPRSNLRCSVVRQRPASSSSKYAMEQRRPDPAGHQNFGFARRICRMCLGFRSRFFVRPSPRLKAKLARVLLGGSRSQRKTPSHFGWAHSLEPSRRNSSDCAGDSKTPSRPRRAGSARRSTARGIQCDPIVRYPAQATWNVRTREYAASEVPKEPGICPETFRRRCCCPSAATSHPNCRTTGHPNRRRQCWFRHCWRGSVQATLNSVQNVSLPRPSKSEYQTSFGPPAKCCSSSRSEQIHDVVAGRLMRKSGPVVYPLIPSPDRP